jgi:hypothetical protein
MLPLTYPLNSALLGFEALRDPLWFKEDTDGCASPSGGVAGVARGFGGLPGPLSAAGRPGSAGALDDGAAHRAAQYAWRPHRPGGAGHQCAAVAGGSHQQAVGRGGPDPAAGDEADRGGDHGRWRVGL